MLIASIPLLALFIMGVYSVVLVLRIEDEYDMRKNDDEQFQNREEARRQAERDRPGPAGDDRVGNAVY